MSVAVTLLSIVATSILLTVIDTRIVRRQIAPAYITPEDFIIGEKLPNVPPDPHILESSGLFEGDIAIRNITEYIEQVNDSLNQGPNNGHANAIKGPFSLWPNRVIPYSLDKSVDAATRGAVATAIDEIQRRTCIKFVSRTNQRDYVNILRGVGCNSAIGDLKNGAQTISLGDGCWQHQTAVHEIMHAIGFFHEQSRNDRDEYVNIYLNNVEDAQKFNFDKMGLDKITHLGTQYDYKSVMHYQKTAFSQNGVVTIEAKNHPEIDLGNNIGLSENDALKINLLYGCGRKKVKKQQLLTKSTKATGNDCADTSSNCPMWAKIGECQNNPTYMLVNCKLSCKSCSTHRGDECSDSNSFCPTWSKFGQCRKNPRWMKQNCKKSCRTCA